MGKQRVFCLRIVLLLAVLKSAVADEPAYFMVGGKLTLKPEYSGGAITSILWKYNGNLLAEWVDLKVDLEYYDTFKNRTALDTSNAHLEISQMRENDKGVYTVEINNKVQDKRYAAEAKRGVPKPKVWIQPLTCGPDALEDCTLTCDGNTDGAEPVTYRWKMGDEEWKETGKVIDITKTGTASIKTFSCEMENPVSMETSEPKDNPLYAPPKPTSSTGAIAGGVVGGLLLAVALGVFAYFKRNVILNICKRGDGEGAVVTTAATDSPANNHEAVPLSASNEGK